MNRKEAARFLDLIADLMEVRGDNPFKIRAFRGASRILPSLEGDLDTDRLLSVKGIGTSLSEVILALMEAGTHPVLEDLMESTPEGILELLSFPGLGPKKVRTLREHLDIASPGELTYAILENRLLDLPGFGEKTQRKLANIIEEQAAYRKQLLLDRAVSLSLAWQDRVPGMIPSGSLRRFCPTIDHLLFLAPGIPVETIQEKIPEVSWNRESLPLSGTYQDVPVTVHMDFHAERVSGMLWETTGSLLHVDRVKQRLTERGLSFPENIASEEALYALVDLPWIPPEARETGDEIRASESGELYSLLSPESIRGCVHNHTTWSDGIHSIREMADAAIKLGWSYLGIADHSRSARYARGLDTDRLLRQSDEIRELNQDYGDFKLLSGVECDILPDGTLDYPDRVLEHLDYVVASIHQNFTLSEEKQTERMIRALKNPHVDILGHPTGRLLLSRKGYALDMDRILQTAAEEHVMIELNANPHRLDLDWSHIRQAVSAGIPIIINPDAHMTDGLDDLYYGVMTARKALLSAAHCANTWTAETLILWWGGNHE